MNEYSPNNRRVPAIRELVGGLCSYDTDGDVIVKWRAPEGGQPSEADIEAKVAEYAAEWDAQEYARNRAAEYPSNGDQWDMIYKDMKNSTTTHADAVEVVKTKWPKDNSGPV